MSERNNFRILNDIVKVKNASVVYDEINKKYHLIHYETEILVVTKDLVIEKALKCSKSSTRAIRQLTDFLGIDSDIVYKSLKPFKNFVKEKYSNDKRLKNNDYLNVLKQ